MIDLAAAYDPWQGDLRLYDPEPLVADERIRAWVRAYRGADARWRAQTSQQLDAAGAYTLLAFARRTAVFAMRHASADELTDGLAGCCAIGDDAVDPRDVLVALAILYHAATRIEEDIEAALVLMRGVGAIATPRSLELLEAFLRRSPRERDLKAAWGHVEVEAPGGAGLLQWGYRPWMPTLDVTGASVDIAAAVSTDRYQADDPTLAVELPEIWLSRAADPALGSILGSARAAASVQGRLRPEVSDDHASQQLTIWVVEAPDAASAQRLAAMSDRPRPGTWMLGDARGALFGLVVARSFVQGVDSYEDQTSLGRFRQPIAAALQAAAGGD